MNINIHTLIPAYKNFDWHIFEIVTDVYKTVNVETNFNLKWTAAENNTVVLFYICKVALDIV